MTDRMPVLWVVRIVVLGPGEDEVWPAPDVRTAVRWANLHNENSARFNEGTNDENFLLCQANVEIWHGRPEIHQEGLADAITKFTPREGKAP